MDSIEESKKESKEFSIDFNKISTGNWGCGMFKGDFVMKFIQQLMAASEAKKSLDYSTYGDIEKCDFLKQIHSKIVEFKLKVSDLFALIEGYEGKGTRGFHEIVRKKLQIPEIKGNTLPFKRKETSKSETEPLIIKKKKIKF